MPSTYSPDLRIELIGPGEQAGTWNTTTNTNLGTLIEDAISGYVSISVTSANQAFTANNGVADQARNAVIALTTTTAANFAVYAPPAAKQYIIYNTTAYVATIYNSTVLGNTTAAGTGVAVPAGKKLVVFSDGTNFSTVDTAKLTGVLAVVDGGTGVTTSTGTGSVVLSNSPTLVTPALGTPASGTLTNTTGLPIDAGTIDTLPVARGGTGVTTATGTGSVVLNSSPELVVAPYINGSLRSNIVAVAALDIDCSTGNYFTKTIAGTSTFTFSNPPASRAYSFTLELTFTSGSVTWPLTVVWPNSITPTITAGKTSLFMFVTDDGGARWRGAALVDYTN